MEGGSLSLVVAGVTGHRAQAVASVCSGPAPTGTQVWPCSQLRPWRPSSPPSQSCSVAEGWLSCLSFQRVNLSVLIVSVLVLFSFFSLISALWCFLSYAAFWSFLLFLPHFLSWVFS